jgi:CDP-6-deoxy-D-xylo-4-hexulose-3-dehydrase
VTTYAVAGTSWGEEERDALRRLIDDDRFTMGDSVRRFEQAFADRLGVPHAVMLNSGSSANLVAVAALAHHPSRPLQRGDEVIVPALSWATTYSPLQQYGLTLRVIDIDLDTLNLDVAALTAALTPRTRMVVAVNVLGNPAPLDAVRRFCDAHGLWCLEDNCESLGASLGGRPCGTFGDVGTFSTFYSHQLSTMEGGMLVTGDPAIAALARTIRNHGWARDVSMDSPAASADFPEAYRFVVPGYNVRPLDLCGAVGLVQLDKLDAAIAARRRNAVRFTELLGADGRFIRQREHGESSWFGFTLIVRPGIPLERATVLDALRAAGIEFRMVTGGCFLRHEAIRHFDHDVAGPIVNANIAHDRGFFVGNHPRDLSSELASLRGVLDTL